MTKAASLQQYLASYFGDSGNIVVYGAGSFGVKLVDGLQQLGRSRIVVVDQHKTGELASVPISHDYRFEATDTVVITFCDLEQSHPVAQELYARGVTDVRLLSNRLRQHLESGEEGELTGSRGDNDLWARIRSFRLGKVNREYLLFSLTYILYLLKGRLVTPRPVEALCPLCTSATQSLMISAWGHWIHECPGCSHHFVANPPSISKISRFYSGYRYFLQNCGFQGITCLTDQAQWQGWLSGRVGVLEFFDLLKDFRDRPASILELGCSEGKLLEYLKQQGHRVWGCDVNTELAAIGSRTFGVDIRGGTLAEAGFEAESFDLVIAFHTVEHLADPVADLLLCRDLLRPGGRILVEVPIGELDYDNRHHLQFFSERSLKECFLRLFGEVSMVPSYFRYGNDAYCTAALALAVKL